MSEWPPKDKPIKAKKKNNPGKHSIPRAPKFELKIKRFVKKVHDKNQPLIKDDKVKRPKPDKQPKDKNRYKWENNYVTEKGETIPRGKRKGPKLDEAKSWDEQGPGTSKFKMRGRGKQSDPKGYPGVKKIRAQKTNYQDPQGEKGEMNRKFSRTTKYKRSSSGYMGITKEVDGKKTRTSFPTTKQLKEHNRWAKEKGMPGLGPGIRKTKTVKDAFGSGDNYVKTYYRGKLKPKTTHYKY